MKLGIDLGGTKIEIIALDDGGTERLRRRIPAPRDDYAATIGAIRELVDTAGRELAQPFPIVGIGTPGAVSPGTNLLKNSNSTWLNGKSFHKDLAFALGRTVRIANDADCFALSEARDGAGAGAPTVFGAILGTGVGGGIVVNGQILSGPNAIAGEWGHNALPWPQDDERPGPACYCGRTGCIETFLSGPGLAADYRGPEKRAAIEFVSSNDPAAAAALSRYENRLARALASVINVLDPHVIVLGGGLSNLDRLYESVPRLWTRWIFSDTVSTRLARAQFGDSSGVRGAAWLSAPSQP